MVQVVRIISIYDMNSENIWFSWSKQSNYRGKLRCHACDGGGRTDGGKWKIVQCSELNQKPQKSRAGVDQPVSMTGPVLVGESVVEAQVPVLAPVRISDLRRRSVLALFVMSVVNVMVREKEVSNHISHKRLGLGKTDHQTLVPLKTPFPGQQLVDCPTQLIFVFHDKAKRTQQENLLISNITLTVLDNGR